MDITIADQRILLLDVQIDRESAGKIAWDKRIDAFGALNKVSSFLAKPKDDDFELVYQELRYQPFWHVIAKARYVYDRSAKYQVPVSSSAVRSVTCFAADFESDNGHFHLPVVEHCVQQEEEQVFVDGINGQTDSTFAGYLAYSPKHITGNLADAVANAIIVPPQSRVSAIMRDALAKMIKGIQADTILEERVEVPTVDLYYRPVYAFQYRWISKGREAITEVDAVSGKVGTGSRLFKEYMGKILDQNFLFDVGADAAGMLIPGGSIAVKVAKKYLDNKDRSRVK